MSCRLSVAKVGLSAVLIFISTSVAVAQSTQKSVDDRGSLVWRARQALQNGQTSITLAQPFILVAETEPLNNALLHTTAVIARVVAIENNHDDYNIFTWRKYRILEKL